MSMGFQSGVFGSWEKFGLDAGGGQDPAETGDGAEADRLGGLGVPLWIPPFAVPVSLAGADGLDDGEGSAFDL